MDDTQRRLIEQYKLRKDSELIALYRNGGLTDVANDTLRQVLLDRGIDIDAAAHSPIDPHGEPEHSGDYDNSKLTPEELARVPDSDQPKGLGGCLILVAIGLPAALFMGVYQLVTNYLPLFTDGVWKELTDPGSLRYIPNWGTLIGVEIAAMIGFMVFEIILLRAFYLRLLEFPRLYISYLVASLIFWTMDAVVAGEMLDASATSYDGFSRQFLRTAIWIPYMLTSRRVKNTFVRTDKAESVGDAHSEETG